MTRMIESKWISSLRHLVHIDIDAVLFHDEALRVISSSRGERILMEMRADHLRHILELNECIEQFGGDCVHIDANTDLCEFHGFTRLHPGMSPSARLTALMEGEEITLRHHTLALREEWAPELRTLIERHLADEQCHVFRIMNAPSAWRSGRNKEVRVRA